MMRLLAFLLVLGVGFCGCTRKGGIPEREEIELQGEKLKSHARSRTVDVVEESYLGARPMPLRNAEYPALDARVTFRGKGSLPELAEALGELSGLVIEVSQGEAPEAEPDKAGKELDLNAALRRPAAEERTPRVLGISYEGPLRGLLEQLAAKSGYGWDYNPKAGTVIFGHVLVRTFTLVGAPGKIEYDHQITNKSRELQQTGGGRSGIGQTVTTGDASSESSQTNKTQLAFDVWDEAEKGVKGLLSKRGTVSVNQSAGTITVRDVADRIRQISAYIDELNARLSRQVALTVKVWSLELTDDADVGLNLQALFQNSDVMLTTAAGAIGDLTGSAGTLAATIVSGKLKDSQAILKALRQWGNATQVTSGGGIVMNNQPMPTQVLQRHSYIAGVSVYQGEMAGAQTEVTPGEVTSGFAMTVTPHIQDKRRVVLQYNISLAQLNEMLDYSTNGVMVQLPQRATRTFGNRMTMRLGQTLVLAGFEHETRSAKNTAGILGGGHEGNYGKTLLVITIEVESAEV